MTDLRQAAQQALEALTLSIPKPRPADDDYAELGWKEHNAAITALRAALAEPQTTHWEGCEAVHPECRTRAELERKSDAIQRLWKERDELRALNAELVEALRGTFQEMLSVVASLNAEQMPHDGDEFHERLEKARAALAKVEESK